MKRIRVSRQIVLGEIWQYTKEFFLVCLICSPVFIVAVLAGIIAGKLTH